MNSIYPLTATPGLAPMHCRVMLIEDDRDIRASIKVALEIESYHVDAFGYAQDALTLLEKAPLPDVIILDLMMPGMSGQEFLSKKESTLRLRQIPVIVISAMRNIEEALESYAVDGILRKPFSINELITLVKTHRRTAQGERESVATH